MLQKLVLLMLGIWSVVTVSPAQITVTNATFPALGDTLFFAFDAAPNIQVVTPPGGNQNWDFSSLRPTFTQRQIFQAPATGTAGNAFSNADLLYLNGTVENYLRITNQEVRLLGYFGTDPLGIGFNANIQYSPPIVERRAPMNFFDINQISTGLLFPFSPNLLPDSLLQRLPIRPDSLRIRLAINRLDVIDAWGNLTIPNQTYPVLREKRTTYQETRLDAKVLPLGWLDVTDIAVQALNLSTLGVDTTITYHFFNHISKEPIAIVTLDRAQANATLVQYKSNQLTTNIEQPQRASMRMMVFPNPASDEVYIRFNNTPPGQYCVKIYDLSGIEIQQYTIQIAENQNEIKLNFNQITPGVYVCRLADSKGITRAIRQIIKI